MVGALTKVEDVRRDVQSQARLQIWMPLVMNLEIELQMFFNVSPDPYPLQKAGQIPHKKPRPVSTDREAGTGGFNVV